jgi:hypothetical protein
MLNLSPLKCVLCTRGAVLIFSSKLLLEIFWLPVLLSNYHIKNPNIQLEFVRTLCAPGDEHRENLRKVIQIDDTQMQGLKRLDQGHLRPKLEVPGLTCPGRR